MINNIKTIVYHHTLYEVKWSEESGNFTP